MVLKQDQERIKTLLKDTITLLCKNGLTFQKEFSLEALIGITLDKDDVFLVSINEIVQSEIKEKSTDEILEDQVRPYVECDGESDGNSSATSTSRKRRKRHRTSKPVRRSSLQDESCDGENSSILSDPEPPEKKSQVKVKTEDVSSDDLVFVKQENEWSQNTPEDTYSNSDTMDLLQHGGAMLEAVPAHAGVDAIPAAAHQRSSSLVRRTATMTTNSGQQENANTQQMGYRSPGSRSATKPSSDEEPLPLMLTSKAEPTALNLSNVATTTAASPVSNHTPQGTGVLAQIPALPPNYVVLSPTVMGPVIGHPLMSPPLALPAAQMVSPLAKALTGANILASVAPFNVPRGVANLTVTSPSIRAPRLASDLPLSSPLSLKSFNNQKSKMRRSSACSSTGSMEPPQTSPGTKPRARSSQRRSSVDVVVSKLNESQENEIITFVNNMSKLGFKVTVREVCSMAHEMIFPKKQYKKVDLSNVKVFGPDWWREFLTRHPEVEEKEGQVFPCSAPRSV